MNKKERSIKALDNFILEVGRNPETVSVGVAHNCAFCLIHLQVEQKIPYDAVCGGCPFANRRGNSGCQQFDTYKELRYETPPKKILFRIFQNLRAIRDVLISIPAKRFTHKGWKYFEELEPLMFIK
jgi:hypothetical protein